MEVRYRVMDWGVGRGQISFRKGNRINNYGGMRGLEQEDQVERGREEEDEKGNTGSDS